MEEGQERDSSSDETRVIIEDEDMEDSPTDTPELWMSERNEDDTKFVRAFGDVIPTKNRAQTSSELSREETDFQRSGQGWYGDTDFVSHRQVLTRYSV
jgi:hypothetical protein